MTQRLLDELNHLGEVNALLEQGGHVGKLSKEELDLHAVAVSASVTPAQFAQHITLQRRLNAVRAFGPVAA